MMSDKPFDKLRPRTQQAIVNEVRRKSEGKYPEPDVDAALRALYPDIPSPHEKFMKSPLDRATGEVFERVFHRWPLAFLRGIAEIGTSVSDMARTYEVERRHYPGSASTYPVNKFGIQILIENLVEEHQWPKELKDAERFMYQMLREYGPYSTEFDMARRMFKWDHAEWVRETPRPTRDAIFHELFAKYTSFAVAESEGIHRIIENELRNFQNFEGFEPSFVASDFLDDDGYFMSYNKSKQKLGESLNPDEYEYWSRYEEIARERFRLEIVPQDDTLIESLPPQLRRDSRFQNPPRFRYGGVNGVLTRDEIIEYVQESDWHYFLQQEDDPTVIQVLRGDGIGETHDNDGWVVVPAETEAVFDASVLWKR